MEIKTLRYFLAIAEQGSLSAAARSLYLTQPTLSRQIRDLEKELGVQLFDRHSHHLTLTQDGVRLRSRALEIVELAERLAGEFTPEEENVSGNVYLGAGESAQMRFIGNVAQSMKKKFPRVNLHLRTGYDTQINEWLDRGIIDFGMLFQPADLSKYKHIRLPGCDRFGLAMRTDNPLSLKECIRPEDLKDEPLIVSRHATRRSFTNNPFLQWLNRDLEDLNIVATMDLPTNASQMVREGFGTLFTFEGITDISEESGLCFKPLEPELAVEADICWKRDRALSRPAQTFFDELSLALEQQ